MAAGVLALAVAACQPEESFGYVQIRRTIAPASNEMFRLNGTVLEELKSQSSVVVKHKAGAARIDLNRSGASWTLCTFDVGKNRIVTVTLILERGAVKCSVQA